MVFEALNALPFLATPPEAEIEREAGKSPSSPIRRRKIQSRTRARVKV